MKSRVLKKILLVLFEAVFISGACLIPAGRTAIYASDRSRIQSDASYDTDIRDEVTIVMAGDVLMHDKVIRSGLKEDGSYNFDHLFAHVKDEIEAADIAIVNQETILGGEELKYSGYPSFNSPFEVGDAEADAGFDVVLQGTNHALDRRARGIENCLEFWEAKHPEIMVLGIHDSAKDQQELCIIDTNKLKDSARQNSSAKAIDSRTGSGSKKTGQGIRVAILNYTYGTNGIQMPKGKGYLVDYLNEKKVRADIERAEKEADITVVCPHWGTEYSLKRSGEQEKWAKLFMECGADLCIGTHPHVIEPLETIKDDKGNEMPVYYSIGNFVNYTSGRGKGVMNRMVGALAEIRIVRDSKGTVRVLDAKVKPVVCHLSEDEIAAYFLEDYTEEMAEDNLIRSQDPDFSLENCEKLVSEVWDNKYIGSVIQ